MGIPEKKKKEEGNNKKKLLKYQILRILQNK